VVQFPSQLQAVFDAAVVPQRPERPSQSTSEVEPLRIVRAYERLKHFRSQTKEDGRGSPVRQHLAISSHLSKRDDFAPEIR
jgi:hypothetical protein